MFSTHGRGSPRAARWRVGIRWGGQLPWFSGLSVRGHWKKAIAVVSPQGSMSNAPSGFGPNEWLVDEMYEQWQADPESVDRAWWDFFRDRQANATATPAATQPAAAQPAPPATQPAAAQPAAASQPAAANPAPAQPAEAKPAEAKPAAQPAKPVSGDETVPLKGASARVVVNMEASLQVPTATSVRAVPAKLLDRQPHRHQQPPQARPRRQGVVHPPHRLRHDQGAQGDAGDELLLRRGRRQAHARQARAHQLRPRHRPAEA